MNSIATFSAPSTSYMLLGMPFSVINAWYAESYNITDWGTGLNSGVQVPEIGYHAHMKIVNGNSVGVLKTNEDYAGKTKADVSDGTTVTEGTVALNRWLSFRQAIQGEQLKAGKTYTISMDIYRVSGSSVVSTGLWYATNTNTEYSFKSGRKAMILK